MLQAIIAIKVKIKLKPLITYLCVVIITEEGVGKSSTHTSGESDGR